MQVETVRVKSDNPAHEGGFVVINKDDFDPKAHELFDAPAPVQAGWGAGPAAEPVGKPAKK